MSDLGERLEAALGGRYRVERELPLGGLGRALLAVETGTARRVSVQVLPPDLTGRLDQGRFTAALERVHALRHPGILPLLGSGSSGELSWCVWAHPRGESLRYRLVRDGGLGEDETAVVLAGVADALAHGHAQGVIHGDLRPDNIYLDRDRPVVAEFGIRMAVNEGFGLGDQASDAQSDVHALAVIGQQLLAGRGGALSGVLRRALSIDPDERFPTAAAFRDALGRPSSPRRRLLSRVAAVGLVIATILGIVFHQAGRERMLDPDLLVVAPFDVLDPALGVWREGIVTVLSGNLDGAGPLRTVSPAAVVRRWDGVPDVQHGARVGRRTGARLAVVGRLERTAGDSVRATATLVDAQDVRGIVDIAVTDAEDRMDRLADSLTVRVLRELGRVRPIAAARTASLGARSLPALKAYLEGEQYYRRAAWDSAIAWYQRAIELDTGFALALYRAGIALGWSSTAADSLSQAYLMHAAAHNRGLPPRDSMLIEAEALSAALDAGLDDPRYWTSYRRLYATTAEAARRYPNDAEVWYEYADARYHNPAFSSLREIREAFDLAIALDSAYAPAYLHQIELALQLGDPEAARGYVEGYLALAPRDVYADAIRLTGRLLDPDGARSEAVERLLDTASVDLLLATIQSFRGWPDTLQTAVRLAGRLVARDTDMVTAHGQRSSYLPEQASALAYRGRLAEAFQVGGQIGWILAAVAWMGGGPRDTVTAVLGWSLRAEPLWPRALAVIGAPVLAQRGDTARLRSLERRADSLARAGATAAQRAFGRYAADGARALQLLVRGDTAGAIRGLRALPDTACQRCVLYRLTLAALLDAKQFDAEAAVLLAQDSPGFVFPTDGFWELYRARLYTRQGKRIEAARAYRNVRDTWRHADAPLQRYVREAEEALARLRRR